MNKAFFGKTIENMRKQRYQACNNRTNKESFSIRTKLSYNKFFFRTFISNRNEWNTGTYE